MKYGKQFQQTLNSPGIPDEWRKQAIEYHKLKKVLNRVASELASLGLTSDVLKDLLGTSSTSNSTTTSSTSTRPQSRTDTTTLVRELSSDSLTSTFKQDDIQTSVQFATTTTSSEDDDQDLDNNHNIRLSDKQRGKRKAKPTRRAHASYELAGTSESPEPRIHIVFSSASSGTESYSSSTEDSFLTGLERLGLDYNPGSTTTTTTTTSSSDDGHNGQPPDRIKRQRSKTTPRFEELTMSSEEDEFDESNDNNNSNNNNLDVDESVETNENHLIEGDFENAGPQTNALLKKMYGVGKKSDDDDDDQDRDQDYNNDVQDWNQIGIHVEPVSIDQQDRGGGSNLQRSNSEATLRSGMIGRYSQYHTRHSALAEVERSNMYDHVNEPKLEIEHGTEADDEADKPSKPRRRRHRPRQHRKEVVIPLTTDNEFLSLLAKALASLAGLHAVQKLNFTKSVSNLSTQVSQVSSPNRPKSDLYIWREIFSLWVETEIFESERERDRGERSVEEVDIKLNWFVDQVAKRKLAKQMRNKNSRQALEKFIDLNVELLEMKKFQLANEEAARKILKKHDKRTALTAQLGFPKFIASSSDLFREGDGPGGSNTRVLTLPGFPSLPHVLLSTFTSTLLPVIPQIEDYECSICGEVAYKPRSNFFLAVRLECGHKFCVRCLVKMQKRGQDGCPQCRAPVVLRANASNLDSALQSYLQLWFPKEVKAKDSANRKEAAREELQEMGLDNTKCLVQ
ncbi:hypothetical protein OIO90_001479 [Microbotryomycetes sp. JL221]|nr:hypothetical protein OIO90_001479 [Microbotryomycetes sp. JL221]